MGGETMVPGHPCVLMCMVDPRRYRYQLLDVLGWTSLHWMWRMRQANQVLV